MFPTEPPLIVSAEWDTSVGQCCQHTGISAYWGASHLKQLATRLLRYHKGGAESRKNQALHILALYDCVEEAFVMMVVSLQLVQCFLAIDT
ncbi:uncharacterized protein ACN427_013816 isoform 2-T2 [Glossina fuscipes fuscipes]